MRSALNTIQRWNIDGVTDLTEQKIKEVLWNHEEIFELIFSKQDPGKNYSFIVGQYSNKVDEVMDCLSKEFIDWIKEKKPEKNNLIPRIIIEVAKYQSMRNTVIDPVTCLLALIFSIQEMTK